MGPSSPWRARSAATARPATRDDPAGAATRDNEPVAPQPATPQPVSRCSPQCCSRQRRSSCWCSPQCRSRPRHSSRRHTGGTASPARTGQPVGGVRGPFAAEPVGRGRRRGGRHHHVRARKRKPPPAAAKPAAPAKLPARLPKPVGRAASGASGNRARIPRRSRSTGGGSGPRPAACSTSRRPMSPPGADQPAGRRPVRQRQGSRGLIAKLKATLDSFRFTKRPGRRGQALDQAISPTCFAHSLPNRLSSFTQTLR